MRKPEPVKKPRLSAFAFGPWSDWLYCSENCGIGETSRTRECSPNGKDRCPADGTCINDSCVYESKQCQIQKCLTCANFPNYCDDKVNTECKDVTFANGELTVSSTLCLSEGVSFSTATFKFCCQTKNSSTATIKSG